MVTAAAIAFAALIGAIGGYGAPGRWPAWLRALAGAVVLGGFVALIFIWSAQVDPPPDVGIN